LDYCEKALYTCCSGSFPFEKCYNRDEDLDAKCKNTLNACKGKCDADAKAKATTDFDVDIEGAFVEEA